MTRQITGTRDMGIDMATFVREQFDRPDKRDLVTLNHIITVDDLRRQRLESSANATTSEYAFAGLPSIPRRSSGKATGSPRAASPVANGAFPQPGSTGGTATAAAVAAGSPHSSTAGAASVTKARACAAGMLVQQKVGSEARERLQAARHLHDKPELYERMVETVGACEILRENRQCRLDSLAPPLTIALLVASRGKLTPTSPQRVKPAMHPRTPLPATPRHPSPGVFSMDVNTVRARTMHRVDVHKELSTTSLRLPSTLKDVKPTQTEDSVLIRLERMYQRVLQSVEEPAPRATLRGHGRHAHTFRARVSLNGMCDLSARGGISEARGTLRAQAAAAAAAATSGTASLGGSGTQMGDSFGMARRMRVSLAGTMTSRDDGAGTFRKLRRSSSGTLAHYAGASGTATSFKPLMLSLPSTPNRSKSPANARTAHNEPLVALPPEMLEAQLAIITAATAANLQRYHAAVAQAEDDLMGRAGLANDAHGMTAEQLESILLVQQAARDATSQDAAAHNAALASSTHAHALKEVSARLAAAKGVRQMIAAAMEHVDVMSSEFEELRTRPAEPQVPERSAADIAAEVAAAEAYRLKLEEEAATAAAAAAAAEEAAREAAAWEAAAAKAAAAKAAKKRSGLSGLMPSCLEMLTAERFETFQKQMLLALSSEVEQPRLIQLPPASNASLMIQARLERIWRIMQTPATARLDMVLRYTARERAMQFEQTLDAWEEAAAAIQRRELLLGDLVTVQKHLEACQFDDISLAFFEHTCLDFARATLAAQAAAKRLWEEVGEELVLGGESYMGPGAVGGEQLLQLMASLRMAAKATMICVLGEEVHTQPIN